MLAHQPEQPAPPTDYDREVEKVAKQVLYARRLALKKAGYSVKTTDLKKPSYVGREIFKRTK